MQYTFTVAKKNIETQWSYLKTFEKFATRSKLGVLACVLGTYYIRVDTVTLDEIEPRALALGSKNNVLTDVSLFRLH